MYHHGEFDLDHLCDLKRGRRISVILPARNEEPTVGRIVATIRCELVERRPLVDEILVVDDHSTDATASVARNAGARVASVDDLLTEEGEGEGKGEAMWKGLYASTGDLVAYCDADVSNFGSRFLVGLLGPLLERDDVGFVKAYYDRPYAGQAHEGGRVTELVARPLLSLLFPALAGIVQPLSGEVAGRREVLEQVPFVEGYGVDIGLILEIADRFGAEAIAQVDLGTRIHRNRPLAELAPQAMAVIQTVLVRAGVETAADGRWSPLLVRPGMLPVPVSVDERPPLVEVAAYRRSA